jgi:hypothetical protein
VEVTKIILTLHKRGFFTDPRFPNNRGPDYGFLFIAETESGGNHRNHIEKNLLTVVKAEKIRQLSSTENQKGHGGRGGKSALQILYNCWFLVTSTGRDGGKNFPDNYATGFSDSFNVYR